MPREPTGRIRFLSDEERERLLAACKASYNSFLYIVVVLTISTGIRQSEIMHLTWQQVDLQRKQIVLEKTKNRTCRTVPITGLSLNLRTGSYMAMAGSSLVEVGMLLGHKRLEMTKRYSHLSQQHLSKIVEKMSEEIFG